MNGAVLDAVSRRLYGSTNRIAFTPDQVTQILARMGATTEAAASLHVRAGYSPAADALREIAAVPTKEADGRTFTFTISTASVDRMNDTIAIGGWKLDAFRKNPVVLWSHLGSMVPIGKASRVWIDGQKLKATAILAPAESNPAAEQVRRLISGGYLAATSVGFVPLKYAFSEAPGRKFGIDFLEQELLEFSIVSVPANPEALIDPGQRDKADTGHDRRRRDLDLIRLRSGG